LKFNNKNSLPNQTFPNSSEKFSKVSLDVQCIMEVEAKPSLVFHTTVRMIERFKQGRSKVMMGLTGMRNSGDHTKLCSGGDFYLFQLNLLACWGSLM
jgi:hypothetical protein